MKKNWSPIVACKVCGESWMWSVENNENFLCPTCQQDPDNVYPDDDWGVQDDAAVDSYVEEQQSNS